MNTFVKNVTPQNLTLCDLNNVVLPPNRVVNLRSFATEAEINASADYALVVQEGFIEVGDWRVNRFAVTRYKKPPTKINLDNIDTITLSTISGYPTTCNRELSISVTAALMLAADPVLALQAATKQYVDAVAVDTLEKAYYADAHLHDGDITIGGDLDVLGILTAPTIVTQLITGIADTAGVCYIEIDCSLNLLNHDIINVHRYDVDELHATDIYVVNLYATNIYTTMIEIGTITISSGLIVDTSGLIEIDADIFIDGNLEVAGVISGSVLEISRITGAGDTVHPCEIIVDCNLNLLGHTIRNAVFEDVLASLNLNATSPIVLTGNVLSFDFSTNNTWTGTNRFGTIAVDRIDGDVIIDGRLDVAGILASSILEIGRITGVGDTAHPCEIIIDCDLHLIDSYKIKFGDNQEAEIYYDGSDLLIDPDATGSGGLFVDGLTGIQTSPIYPLDIDGGDYERSIDVNAIKNTQAAVSSLYIDQVINWTGSGTMADWSRLSHFFVTDNKTVTGVVDAVSVYYIDFDKAVDSQCLVTGANIIDVDFDDTSTYHNQIINSSHYLYGSFFLINWSPTINTNLKTHRSYIYGHYVSPTWNPTLTSGTLIGTVTGYSVSANITGTGTTTFYAFENAFAGGQADTEWCFYNRSAIDNLLGWDSSKTYFGTGYDAYLEYDGTNFLIKPDAVGSGYVGIDTSHALALVLGNGTAGIDYILKFDGESSDGTITWLEDEETFLFDGNIDVVDTITTSALMVSLIAGESGTGIHPCEITIDCLTTFTRNVNINGTLQANNDVYIGADGAGHDLFLYGATSGRNAVWDASDDAFELTDNVAIAFGAGGLTGALGCDGKIYSDGTNVHWQLETPTHAAPGGSNPSISLNYFSLTAANAGPYIPVIQSNGVAGQMMISRVLYVQDATGANDSQIQLRDKTYPLVNAYGYMTYDTANTRLNIGVTGGTSLRLSPGGVGTYTDTQRDFKIHQDNIKIYFGLSDDASIEYDASDWIFKPDEVGTGRFKITCDNDIGQELLWLDQNDQDQAFIYFDGTTAADVTKNESTLGIDQDSGAGTVAAPDHANWDCKHLIKVKINDGSDTEYWLAAYQPN